MREDKMFKVFDDAITKERIKVPLTEDEISAATAKQEAENQAEAQAAAAKAALLEKLGITEEEARLLLGGN